MGDTGLFSALGERERQALLGEASIRQYPRNSVVLASGETSDAFYLIRSGKIRVSIGDQDGNEVILSVLGPGDHFGEMALIDGRERSATISTVEDTELTVLSREQFRSCLARHPEVASLIMLSLVERLRLADRKIESLAVMDVYGRLARMLLHLASEGKAPLVISKCPSHRELAGMIGVSPDLVSRIMGDLEHAGYITVADGQLLLHERLSSAP